MTVPRHEDFLDMPAPDVAGIVRAHGPKVCVFPWNGSRRWFMCEHATADGNWVETYLDTIIERLVEICGLFFDHGVDTLVLPALSPRVLDQRSERYSRMALGSLGRLVEPPFDAFYREAGVRVRFYGDYRRHLQGTPYEGLLDVLDDPPGGGPEAQRRIFWGVFAHDAMPSVAELAVRFHAEHGRVPGREELVRLYYGEDVGKVDFFICSAKPRAFDMPLIGTGEEDLYFTVAPSPYLEERQLREILYDHLYTRRKEGVDYKTLKAQDVEAQRAFFHANRGRTLGVGAKLDGCGLWHPVPQVELPAGLGREEREESR